MGERNLRQRDGRLKPDFFVPGVVKGGTTALYAYLKQHPGLYLPDDKEPHFFDDNTYYREGRTTYVEEHFSTAPEDTVIGEATPSYFHRYRTVIPRMKSMFGETSPKFVVIFRDPVWRAWSHYLHRRREAVEERTFRRALEEEMEGEDLESTDFEGYITTSAYAQCLEKWLNKFPRDRFCFLLSKDLKAQTSEQLKRVFRFLGVEEAVEIEPPERSNPASQPKSTRLMKWVTGPSTMKEVLKPLIPPYWRKRMRESLIQLNLTEYEQRPELDSEMENELRGYLKPDVERLEDMIDRDLTVWKQDGRNV